MAPGGSKDLLALEHRSKEQHLERLLASRTKPNIERMHSTVLQDVQRFLPLMQKANERLDQRIVPGEAESAVAGDEDNTDNLNPSRSEACFELDENYEGTAIEMNLMLAAEDQIKMITDMDAVVGASERNVIGDSDDSSDTEDSEPDSSSDDNSGQAGDHTKMEVSQISDSKERISVMVSASGNTDDEALSATELTETQKRETRQSTTRVA